MSLKRSIEIVDMDDASEGERELEEIMQSRKLRKRGEGDIIGFCDNCERLTSVKQDKEQSQFNYCIDCEIDSLAFCTEFLTVKTEGPVIEEEPEEPAREVTCRGCIDNESNQLAHMNQGGCLCGEDDGEDD